MKWSRKTYFWQIIAVFIWLCLLISTDSYYSVYILIGLFSSYAIYKNTFNRINTKLIDRIFAITFSSFVCLANYSLFNNTIGILQFVLSILMLISGYIVFLNILLAFKKFTIKTSSRTKKEDTLKTSLICFGIMALFYILILFLCCYPGTLTSDSINQVEQFLSGSYSNHHPFFVTLIMKFFILLGSSIFGNLNAGIATYSVFQILLLSASFSYAIYTMHQVGVSKKIIICFFAITMIMPYNIMYSFTLWKDILFGIAFLIFITTLYRFFRNLNSCVYISYILLALSGTAICLFRSNGLIAFLAATIIFIIMFRKKYLKLGLLFCGIIILSFCLKKPLLAALDVKQPDILESLSIPMQQVTRTLVENKNSLSEEDLNLINNVANPDRLIEEYDPIIHDPIKYVVRREGDKSYLENHKLEFLKLYIKLGIKNPLSYIKAWVAQTRGYWNSGYSYWKWSDEISPNQQNLEKTIVSGPLHSFLHFYLDSFEKNKFLNPLISIGLFAWIMLFILYKSIISKDKHIFFITILLTITWGTLLIATPVFAEFRYVYFLFTCMPPLSILSLIKLKKEKKWTK